MTTKVADCYADIAKRMKDLGCTSDAPVKETEMPPLLAVNLDAGLSDGLVVPGSVTWVDAPVAAAFRKVLNWDG